MRFDWPASLWLLLPVGWMLWQRHRRAVAAVPYSSMELVPAGMVSWRTRWAWLADLLGALSAVLLVFALGRPQRSVQEFSRVREGVAIELLVDVSSSMATRIPDERVPLSRLATVKEVLQRFILGNGRDLEGRPDDLIGLVAFARYADTISPLTEAHDALAEMVRDLTIEDRPNEDGTAYGDAVTLAAARLHLLGSEVDPAEPNAKVKSRVIVLLTDGENNCGRHLPLEATALAKAWGIRVYVISLVDSLLKRQSPGESEPVPSVAEQTLMRMASETGGIYRRADDLESLQAVYRRIDTLEKSRIQRRKQTGWQELFPAFNGLALALLVAEAGLRSLVFRRIP